MLVFLGCALDYCVELRADTAWATGIVCLHV